MSVSGIALPFGQMMLLVSLLGFCGPLMLATLDRAAVTAVALLAAVATIGLVLCRRTCRDLGDPKLELLGHFWLTKLLLTIFLAYVGWMPELAPFSTPNWGVDYQRFYADAQELIDNHWSTDFVSLNYTGILYYYAAIFLVIGRNPVIPALVNTLVTLVACLYLVRTAYEIKRQRGPVDWSIGLVLLLPELVWFDVVTSREMLMAALVLIATLAMGRYFARPGRSSLPPVMLLFGSCVMGISAVRTGMVMPVCGAVALMIVMVRAPRGLATGGREAVRLPLLLAAVGVPLLTQGMASLLGGYDFDLSGRLQGVTQVSEDLRFDSDLNWSDNSIGLLLVPNGFLQSILLMVPRMVLYLVAPLPDVTVPINELLAGNMVSWQKLCLLASSMINIVAVPYVLAALVHDWRRRRLDSTPLIFHLAYWATFIAVAGGNLTIHERYRIMASMLMWGCAWLGATTAPRALVGRIALAWYGSGAIGTLAILAYKAS